MPQSIPTLTPNLAETRPKLSYPAKSCGEFAWKVGFDEACRDFQQFQWMDDHRIGAMLCGQANCLYWIVDADSSLVLQKLVSGFDFLWSHNRKWLAHRQIPLTLGTAARYCPAKTRLFIRPSSRRTMIFPIGNWATLLVSGR